MQPHFDFNRISRVKPGLVIIYNTNHNFNLLAFYVYLFYIILVFKLVQINNYQQI